MSEERPTCRHCGKKLGKYTTTIRRKPEDPPLKVGDMVDRFGNGILSEIKGITRKGHRPAWGGEVWYGCWFGKYGRNSDGYFCGTDCGYRWAVKHLKTWEK